MHVVEQDVASNENSLPRNPKHRVFIGVALDVFKDLNLCALKFNGVAVEFADGNNVRGCTWAKDLLPLIYFPLIDLVDPIYYRRTRNDSDPRICLRKDLQAKKMVGVLMGNVDNGEGLFGLFDFLVILSQRWFLLTAHRPASLRVLPR
jgi:hypothetical protein